MIGLALVVFVTIFAAGLRATIDQGIDDQVRAAGIVKSSDGFLPLPEGVVETLENVDGVAAVSPIRFETGKLKSDGKNVADHRRRSGDRRRGAPARVEPGLGAARSTDSATATSSSARTFAKAHNLDVGDSVTLITPRGHEIAYKLAGTYDAKVGLVGDVDRSATRRSYATGSPRTSRSRWSSPTRAPTPTELKRAEDKALAGFPTAKPQTIDDFKDEQNDGIDVLVGPDLRAAVAVGDRRAARHRQHAGAVGARAHARARHAAGGRHEPLAGAADDRAPSR